ncbi:MAG: polysaccharide deacetylase family protein [Thermoleophilaceae bacterium]
MLLALAPVWPRIAASAGIPLRLETAGVALTFDDGPDPEGTPAILDVLDRAGVKATFFLVGEQVERHPAVAAEVAVRGHLVALHCHRHRVQLRLGTAAIRDDLERAGTAIREATGAEPRLHRPPLGIYSAGGLRVAREAGLEPLLWSRWGMDWRKWTTPQRIAARAARELHGGDVILLHDADHYSARGSWRRTAQALPGIVAAIEGAGLRATQPTGSGSAAAASDSVSQPR